MLLKQKFNTNYNSNLIKNKNYQIYFVLFLILFPLLMILKIYNLDYRANLFPISLCLIAIFLLFLILSIKVIDLKKHSFSNYKIINFINSNIYEKNEGFNNQFFYYLSFIGYLGLNFIVGFPIASFLFINGFILFHNKRDYKFSILISIILMLVLWFLSSMLTLQFPNGVIGMFVNLPWWLGGSLN